MQELRIDAGPTKQADDLSLGLGLGAVIWETAQRWVRKTWSRAKQSREAKEPSTGAAKDSAMQKHPAERRWAGWMQRYAAHLPASGRTLRKPEPISAFADRPFAHHARGGRGLVSAGSPSAGGMGPRSPAGRVQQRSFCHGQVAAKGPFASVAHEPNTTRYLLQRRSAGNCRLPVCIALGIT